VDTGDAGWAAAMDWAIGSLEDLLKARGKLSLAESSYSMLHLVDGLSYAYIKDRVLHLDLKPANVLYHLKVDALNDKSAASEDSACKFRFMISDWGIASIKQHSLAKIAGMPPSADREQYTFNNFGTANYMAPERFQKGRSSSVASDVFSLGMIYLKMLTGSLPFHTSESAARALTSGSYFTEAALLLRSANVPKSVGRLVLSMVARTPSDRPRDYRSLRQEIISANNRATGWFSKIANW
jgi:serine/threonine protein kinase